ncbi:RHS repeat protein, partial [Snodgrassella sp. B3837]|nr:RHS repeat protein [Snodgrassella sp. B3837]
DPDGSTWRYYYDERGNLLTVIDPLKQRTHYQYDQHGQITRITDARGGHKYLRWNPNGQLIQHTDCSGSLTQLGYDRHGNLTDITNAIGNSSRYQRHLARWPPRTLQRQCSRTITDLYRPCRPHHPLPSGSPRTGAPTHR